MPSLFAAWTMAKARRALLSETWGWVAAVGMGIAMALLDVRVFVAWPDFVDIDVVWRAEPSIAQFVAPVVAAGLTSLALRLATAARYARLSRAG